EDFRQTLIATIAEWEATHELDDPEWDYYQCWLAALEKLVVATGVVEAEEWQALVTQLLDCKGTT
ncbi:MAG: nitrile hydratase accessory protein, partial [Cyanobacteria bacterium P01_C01_bin.121]